LQTAKEREACPKQVVANRESRDSEHQLPTLVLVNRTTALVLLPHSTYIVPSLSALVTTWMSSLKRKRSKSNDGSAGETGTSDQPLPTPTVALGRKGKKRARNTIPVERQQV
jgi:hypothetical protein